jgi:hypothetical protein
MEEQAFERFVADRKKDLQRIARHTRGELEFSDVVSEAWLMACGWKARTGSTVDLLNRSSQEQLISYLYQQLVRYTELNVRHAVRLDHGTKGGDQEDECHPLMRTLVSDDGRDPLATLIARQTESLQNAELDRHPSLAGAYVRLLSHFDNSMRAVADHLLISLSYAYRRCAHARLLAVYQAPLQLPLSGAPFVAMPWRSFRLRRPSVQLAFDFEERLPLDVGDHDAGKLQTSG